MSNVTMIRPDAAIPPHSVEAEQQLLGALLVNNDCATTIGAILQPGDFYDPIHEQIYSIAMAKIDRGELASPVTVRMHLDEAGGLAEVGGANYLVKLAGASIASFAVKDYAKLIRDAAARRHALDIISAAQSALLRGEKATGDIMGDLESALVAAAPADSKLRPRSFLSAATSALLQISNAYHGEDVPSVAAPWGALRQLIPSFHAGDMVVLAGRPSMGKSAVALSMATHAAWAGHPVVFASLEMTPEDVAKRALSEGSSLAGDAVAYTQMSDGTLTERGFRKTVEVAKQMEALPIQFLTEDFSKPGALRAGVKQALRSMGDMGGKTPLIIVDYMQLMKGEGRDIREKITDISMQMKHLALSLGAVNIALSQLSRALESRDNKRPQLSDLRESGQIEQDADVVLFCYRDEYYIERERPDTGDMEKMMAWESRMKQSQGKLELIVGKQRRGPIGTAHLNAALKFNRIWGFDD